MNFPSYWISLIMECITTVSYQLIINGGLSKLWKPNRGIRQGDPLSPYLFHLSQNILSLMLTKAEDNNLVSGVSKDNMPLNHLLFVDDCYIFYQANVHSSRNMRRLLNQFCHISGQKFL